MEKISNSKVNYLTLAFLFCSAFLEYKLFNWPLYVYASALVIFFCFFSMLNRCKGVKTYYLTVLFFFLSNVGSSLYFRNQSPMQTLYASNLLMDFFFFFVVAFFSPNEYELDRFIQRVIKIVLIAYFIQLIVYPIAIWGTSDEEWIMEEGITYRALIVGCQHVISLGVFYYLLKYLRTKQLSNIILFLLCLSTIFIRASRMMSLASIIAILYLVGSYSKKKTGHYAPIKIIGILFVLFIIGNILYMTSPVVHENISLMIERLSSSEFNVTNDDYIRTMTIGYYYTEFFQDPIEMILGSGMPSTTGQYGMYVRDTLIREYKFNYVDWGLIGLSWFAGIPLVLSIIYGMIKAIRAKVDSKLLFVGAWFIYTLFVSITDPEAYQHHAFIVESIAFYALYLNNPRFLKWNSKK